MRNNFFEAARPQQHGWHTAETGPTDWTLLRPTREPGALQPQSVVITGFTGFWLDAGTRTTVAAACIPARPASRSSSTLHAPLPVKLQPPLVLKSMDGGRPAGGGARCSLTSGGGGPAAASSPAPCAHHTLLPWPGRVPAYVVQRRAGPGAATPAMAAMAGQMPGQPCTQRRRCTCMLSVSSSARSDRPDLTQITSSPSIHHSSSHCLFGLLFAFPEWSETLYPSPSTFIFFSFGACLFLAVQFRPVLHVQMEQRPHVFSR